MCCQLLLMSAWLLAQPGPEGGAGDVAPPDVCTCIVERQEGPRRFFVGDPVFVTFRVRNPCEVPRHFEFSPVGGTYSIGVQVKTEGGEDVQVREDLPIADRLPLGDNDDSAEVRPGGSVLMGFRVDDIFQLQNPGVYIVELKMGAARINERIELLQGSARDVAMGSCGVVARPDESRTQQIGAVPLAYQVVWEEAQAADGEFLTRVTVRGERTTGDKDSRVQRCTFERRLTVESVMIDWRWLAWTVLRSGDERELVVWDLWRGSRQTAIPWTDRAIVVEAFPKWNNRVLFRDVMARLGEDRVISTASLTADLDRERE